MQDLPLGGFHITLVLMSKILNTSCFLKLLVLYGVVMLMDFL